MTDASAPAPRIVPLDWITPSLANDLLDCPYRVAWQRDTTYRSLRRPSTYSELGVVAHGVIEDASHGRFTGGDASQVRTAIEERWDERATQAQGELASAWAPAQVPPKEQWPGYHLTKARVIRHATERSAQSEQRSERFTSPSVETSIADEKTMIRGRPDRVEGPHGARRVVDVKSGLRQAEPSPPQLRQLMLYGHLVEATTDDRVEEIAIEDASGKRWVQDFDRAAAKALVAEITHARETFNASTGSPLVSHAMPSADGCRWCAFKVVCAPYWSALETTWEHGSALGIVRRAQPAATGSVLELEVDSPQDAAGTSWVVSGAPIELAEVGRKVAMADAELTGAEHHLRWRWSTSTWPALTPEVTHKT